MSLKTVGIGLAVIFVVVVGIAMIPNPGKRALQREQQALSEVTSWRITTQVSKNSRPYIQRTYAAVCPDREHLLEYAQGDLAEYIRVGDDEYYRKNTYQWVKGSPGPDLVVALPAPRFCLSNPGEPSSNPPGGAETIRLELEAEMKDGQIEKGALKSSPKNPCQEWTVTRMMNSRLGNYITCLSLTTYLPVYTRNASEDFYMYYEWGAPVTIEAPDLTPPGKPPVAP